MGKGSFKASKRGLAMTKTYEHRCVMCLKIEELNVPPTPDEKYLCDWCFRRVKKEFEKQNPGQSLRAEKEKEEG